MSFSLSILVRNPEPALIKAVCERHRPTARVSRNGTLVIRHVPNRDLSSAIYPNEWKMSESRRSSLAPDFSGGAVHTVYDVPEVLNDVPHQIVLNGAETHHRGVYCQIVTDYDGNRLRPYRREGYGGWGSEYEHPTVSIFSAPRMGLLRFDQGMRFTIQRGSAAVIDGVLTTKTEELLRDNERCELTNQLTSLPAELSAWTSALTAVLDRYQCKLNTCQGHYHLD